MPLAAHAALTGLQVPLICVYSVQREVKVEPGDLPFLELERKTDLKTGWKGSDCLRRSFFVPMRTLTPTFVSFGPLKHARDCDISGGKEK